MADIPSVNPGAEPLKKSTGKVQPKKETVRINLPPKPTAAPTIKLPTLPPGGPSGVPAAKSAAAPAQAAPAPRAAAAPVAQRPGAAPTSAPLAQRPAVRQAAPAAATISGLDKGLALAAAVTGLIAVGSVLYLMFGIPTGN